MSASAWSKLFVGWKSKDEFLYVPDGKHWECYHPRHDLKGSTGYCPVCGGRVSEVDTMVPSPLIAHFAHKRGISVEEALGILEPYQHSLPKHWNKPDSECWVLGVEVIEVGSSSWEKVIPEMPSEVRSLLIEAGMPVGGEAIYLATWLE